MHSTDQLTDRLKRIIETQSILASGAFDLDQFMTVVVNQMQALTPATGAVVELLENDEMVYKAASGTVAPFVGLRLQSVGSLSGLCVQDREMKIAGDTSSDPRVNAEACKKVGAASMVCVPLFRRGEAVGVLKVLSTKSHAFLEHDLETLSFMAGLLGGALGQQLEIEQRQKLEEQLRHMAQHDNLTSLPNRALFHDRLAQAIARSTRNHGLFALFYMDIDHFKPVNDTYGHDAGDELLKMYSHRVRAVTRSADTLARLGGDEFTLIAEDLHDASDAETIAAKIVGAARQEFQLSKVSVKVSSSIGIALCTGDSVSAEELIKSADQALYAAKKAGRDCYKFSVPG